MTQLNDATKLAKFSLKIQAKQKLRWKN